MYSLTKLFAFKQHLLEEDREKEGIKWHMLLHVPFQILYFGPACNFDMVKYEKAHGEVKHIFEATSKRYGTANDEMLAKFCTNKVIKSSWIDVVQIDAKTCVDKISRLERTYQTPTDMIYESFTGPSFREEIIYDNRSNTYRLKGQQRFINPVVYGTTFNQTMRSFYEYLCENDTEMCEGTSQFVVK